MSCEIDRKHRSRPIELYIPMEVIFEDERKYNKGSYTENDHKDIKSSNLDSKKKEDIPIPGVRINESYEKDTANLRPFLARINDEYITYTPHIDDESGYNSRIPEYGVDDEDIEWLNKEKFDDIDEGDFELILDVLEKESIRQREFRQVLIDSSIDSEEDVPCCVCGDRDYTDNNLIIFCDGCNLAIHQACQDLDIVPEDDWFCDSCEYYRSHGYLTDDEKLKNPIVCIMCKKTGYEAFKRTNQNSFIHIVCALMTSELYFENNCVNIDYLDPERNNLECDVCNEIGGCVQCHVKSCFKSFHTICARNNGQVLLFHYEQEEDEKKGKKKKEETSPFQILCPHHSAIHRSKQLEEMRLNAKNVKIELGRFIDKSTLKQCRSIVGKKFSKETFNKICDYWKAKRLRYKNGRVPFIYQLNIVIEFEREEFDSGLKLKNKPRKEEIIISQFSTEKKYLTMVSVRQYLEKLRLVLDMVRKREITKRRRLKVLEEILEKGELSLFSQVNDISTYKKPKKSNNAEQEADGDKHISINESDICVSPTKRPSVTKQTLMTQYLTSFSM